MNIAIIKDNNVESVGDINTLFPNISFPPSGPSAEWMKENSIKYISYWKPHNRETEWLCPSAPYLENGEVFMVVVAQYTDEQLKSNQDSKWAKIRSDRSRLLAESDWTQFNDSPLSVESKSAWATYRQALRDITLQEDPYNIVWPEEP